jgi:hypothetical protein
MSSIVQFAHPGAEHGPDKRNGNRKSWNTESHRRKFLRSDGRYIDADGAERMGKLQFWGEWEPPSKVAEFRNRPDTSFPRWVHEPIIPAQLPRPGSPGNFQNTDPFVFGDCFKYFVCKQWVRKTGRTTSLARLDKGSLILFGSTHGNQESDAYFQLDTVFVVGDFIDYDVSDPDALLGIPGLETYRKIVYKMAFPFPSQQTIPLRLYFGATPDKPISGMYSFSPAQTAGDDICGFPRVALRDMPFLTNNLNALPRISKTTQAEVIAYWESVMDETRRKGLVEGFGFRYRTESSVPAYGLPDAPSIENSHYLC